MKISPIESRILKKVIRTWIESEYENRAKLNHLKQNIDDSTWKFAQHLHSETGRVASLDFIFETITETVLILYPEYDAKERKRQKLEDAECKRTEVLEATEQRRQRKLETIQRREEEEERRKREDILRGDIDRIRVIVCDCVCEILGEEPEEGIDDQLFSDDLGANELDEPEIGMAIEAALETATGTKFELPYNLLGSTINEIAKAVSFYFKHGRYPKKSHIHGHVVAASRVICQLETDAKTLKATLRMLKGKTGNEFSKALSESPLANNSRAGSVLGELFIKHTRPWAFSKSQQDENIENLISATQVLIDNPHYSNDYGYDEIEPAKE